MAYTTFSKLVVGGWRQFDAVDIDLHPNLTVITGTNGSGKSTLLSIFSRHFGWNRPLLNVPKQDDRGNVSYIMQLFEVFLKTKLFERKSQYQVGNITYSNGQSMDISADNPNAVTYNLNVHNNFGVQGLYIDSHKVSPSYQAVTNISLQAITAEQAFQTYNAEMMQRYNSAQSYNQFTPMYRMKEAIISMAVFGEGNSKVGHDSKLLTVYEGFNDILRNILPETLGFIEISVRKPEVVLVTKSGDFMIDAASGGISTLIDIAWRIYMFSIGKEEFVVTMDEPENHLHPTMQRSLMRRLIKAFPKAQFIIATHSPFMVSSVRNSHVYVLRYKEDDGSTKSNPEFSEFMSRRVVSEKLDNLNKAGSASDILREVLGVSATMPEWVEEGLGSIIHEYKNKEFTRDTLNELRAELNSKGYNDYYPEVISQIAH